MRPVTSKKGFTILEIIVATTLLAVVGSTLFASFTNSSALVKGQQHVAYNVARQYMENLHESVRDDQWSSSAMPLSLITPRPQPPATTLQGVKFTPTYTVNGGTGAPIDVNGDGTEDYRKVEMTVQW